MRGYNGLYLMGNFPDPATFIAAASVGLRYFNFLEVGIPFSDPVADGPVIEQAAGEVLEKGYCAGDIFKRIEKIVCPPGKKIYIMTYANQIVGRGDGAFVRMMKQAGAHGIILPDVPSVERARFEEDFAKHGIDFIRFITPESTNEQILKAVSEAAGFVYCISIRGITGSALSLDVETRKKIAFAKKHSKTPVVLGFGIRDAESARVALHNADGFIMGTCAIEILKREGVSGLENFFAKLTAALA